MNEYNIEDLMVGDYVKIDEYNHPYFGYNGKIAAINCFTNYLIVMVGSAQVDVFIEDVAPIRLNVDILKNNGFDVSDGEVMRYYPDEGTREHFSLRQMYNKNNERDGFSFFAFNVLTIVDSVSDLQHAFKICGIKKDIVI